MRKPERTHEEWKVICGILIAVIIFLIYGWYNSEQNRLKLLDELETVKSEYAELYKKTR